MEECVRMKGSKDYLAHTDTTFSHLFSCPPFHKNVQKSFVFKKKKQKTLSCPQIMNHSFSFLLFQPYSTLIFTVVSSFSLSNPFQPLYVALPLGTSLVHFNTLLNSEFNTHLWIDPTAALITTAQHSDCRGQTAHFCTSSHFSEYFCLRHFLLFTFLHPISGWFLMDSTTTVC